MGMSILSSNITQFTFVAKSNGVTSSYVLYFSIPMYSSKCMHELIWWRQFLQTCDLHRTSIYTFIFRKKNILILRITERITDLSILILSSWICCIGMHYILIEHSMQNVPHVALQRICLTL